MSQSKLLTKSINIDLEYISKKWRNIENIDDFLIETINKILINSPLKNFLKKGFLIELSIILCNNLQIKRINKKFRKIDKPTNILSFANLDEINIQKNGLNKTIGRSQFIFLGELILSYEYIQNELRFNHKNFFHHLTHLLTHGILHLIGFDHEDQNMANKMENLEIKILKKLNINNPYKINEDF
jgi:probable rRNA maturation factor